MWTPLGVVREVLGCRAGHLLEGVTGVLHLLLPQL